MSAETLQCPHRQIRGRLYSQGFVVEVARRRTSSNLVNRVRRNAFAHFEQQPASVSFADCLVMAFADFYGIRDFFGFDEVFARNGYHSLLQRQQAS